MLIIEKKYDTLRLQKIVKMDSAMVMEVSSIKVIHKFPKTDEKTHFNLIHNGWIQLKEPKTLLITILASIPIMVINTLISIGLINIFSEITLKEFGITAESFAITIRLDALIGIFLTLVIHELIHLLFIPDFMKSKKTFIGVTFFGGYVYTAEEISKTRYIIISIAPFIILSIFLPSILGLLGLLTPIVKFLILLNAASSSVDLFNLFLVLTQVPKGSVLKSNGMKTYWKVKD